MHIRISVMHRNGWKELMSMLICDHSSFLSYNLERVTVKDVYQDFSAFSSD
jgi:hypothetical protein